MGAGESDGQLVTGGWWLAKTSQRCDPQVHSAVVRGQPASSHLGRQFVTVERDVLRSFRQNSPAKGRASPSVANDLSSPSPAIPSGAGVPTELVMAWAGYSRPNRV